ncbi:unnamed protein product [Phytophthora lilii]|uniref:Unnamed protein product n=1 Tax=Phytophthora lilii TaxID=2077276 RepID=A0A9W6U475_9STRA|nr:unnamed protein product [Phytophthora lilii]
MITRAVPSIAGSTDPAGFDSSGQSRLRPPEDVLRQARATSVASYALDILQELKDETVQVQDQMARLHQRIDNIADIVDGQIRQTNGSRKSDPGLLHLLPTQEESDRVLCIQTISSSFSTDPSKTSGRPAAVVAAYERCEGVPLLELQREASGNQVDHSIRPSSSISRKKYSNPGFFLEEWLKNEEGRQQRALEIKEERRRERRDAQNLRKTREHTQQQQSSSTEDAKSSGSTDDAEQKMKFLKIRSWREIYGTGEGKELMKQQQQSGRSPSLRDLRMKAHQGLASITQSPPRAEAQRPILPPPPPPPPPPAQPNSNDGPDHTRHQSLTTEQLTALAPPDPPSIPASLGGAFMQEMDDDEITMEMQLEDEFPNGILPPPPPPDSTHPEEFTDHGLSYYYDPSATHNLTPPPPPPPPPELDEQSKSDVYLDAYDDDENAIPPPPAGELEPPPPPPSPPRVSSLLEEIQLGAALRSVSQRPAPPGAPARPLSPQSALLQQILQKQSRGLRPVEPRRPPLHTRVSSSAPFADSIARILERRSVIAYDSDSSQSSGHDDDW